MLSTPTRALDNALGGGPTRGPAPRTAVPGRRSAGRERGLLPTGPVRTAVSGQGRAVVYRACGPSRQDVAVRVIAAHLGVDHLALRDSRLEDAELAAAEELSGRPEGRAPGVLPAQFM